MQRKFLEYLGLNKEVIDKVMTENGVDIEKTKTSLNIQISDLKSQLTTTKDILKSFEGINVKELQGRITQLQKNLSERETDYSNLIADMKFNSILDSTITSCKAKNSKAVKALLDIETLKSSKNQAEDMKVALETVARESPYLFDNYKVQNQPPPYVGNYTLTYPKTNKAKICSKRYRGYRFSSYKQKKTVIEYFCYK